MAGAGAELLVLCETVTEDGSLNKEEIFALRSWLLANKCAGLDAETKTLNEYADFGWDVSAGYSQQRPGANKITGHATIRRPKSAK